VTTLAPQTHAGDAAAASRTGAGRLEFLDTVRGVAALVVALQHTSEEIWSPVLAWSHTWFRPGEFGVLAFFLCSGFIIPASLEKRGRLGEFWVGRFFRLWPLYLAMLAAVAIGFVTIPQLGLPTGTSPLGVLAVNATMVQVFTEVPILIGASWTLGYELVFYLLVSGLFALGVHKRSAELATSLFAGALLLGAGVPVFLMTKPTGHGAVTVLALLLIVAIPILWVRGVSPRMRAVAAVCIVPAVLLVANRPHEAYFALMLLGTMFVGTVMYRWTSGELSGRTAWSIFVGAMLAITLGFRAYHVGYAEPITGATPQWWTEAVTFVGAYLFFGAMLLLRRHRFPRPLVYLGTISYSVYLAHAVVLVLVPRIQSNLGAFVLWNAVTLLVASLTYRLIERPAQDLGRRVMRRMRGPGSGDAEGRPNRASSTADGQREESGLPVGQGGGERLGERLTPRG
jgi:peptidoglycan/LPS O-acetylase OafA/YrhL